MSLTVQQLRSLVAVIDKGSFTLAASDLGVSQSAVSHAIASMERELGGALVVREIPLVPTPLGHRVLAHARSAAAAIDALESAARGDESLQGVVRLGTVPTVCQGLMPSLLEEWSIALPGVRVEVYEGDDDEIPEWLDGGLVDVAILVEPEVLPEGSRIIDIDEFAAVVRDVVDVEILDANVDNLPPEKFREEIASRRPDYVGISLLTTEYAPSSIRRPTSSRKSILRSW